MKTSLAITIACLALVGCKYESKITTSKSESTNLEDLNFRLGVQCAINAHLTYVKDGLLAGQVLHEMEVKAWEKKAEDVRVKYTAAHP